MCGGASTPALTPLRAVGKLGAVPVQYPQWVGPRRDRRRELKPLPERLPDTRIAVEFRSPRWLAARDDTERTLDRLERLGSRSCASTPEGLGLAAGGRGHRGGARPSCASTAATTRRGRAGRDRRGELRYASSDGGARGAHQGPVAELAGQARETYALMNNCHRATPPRCRTCSPGSPADDDLGPRAPTVRSPDATVGVGRRACSSGRDRAEQPVLLVVGPSGEEQRGHRVVVGGAVPELERPQAVDGDRREPTRAGTWPSTRFAFGPATGSCEYASSNYIARQNGQTHGRHDHGHPQRRRWSSRRRRARRDARRTRRARACPDAGRAQPCRGGRRSDPGAAGVRLLLDVCQSVGRTPIEVEAIGCDVLSATSRELFRGARGTGFRYVRRELLDHAPRVDPRGARGPRRRGAARDGTFAVRAGPTASP
jgi:Protein of unknown function DUF72/Aminotransferase class-V